MRPYLNKVALPDFAGRCTTELIPLLPMENVDRLWLTYLLRSPATVDVSMRDKTGSRMPRADMETFLSMPISLPPIAEQQKIAAQLTEQMAHVRALRTAIQARIAAVNQLPATLLAQAFAPRPA